MRSLWILAVAALALPASLRAQRGVGKCGTTADNWMLQKLAHAFSAPEEQAWRQRRQVALVPPAAPHIIVRDEKVCGRVLNAGRKYLNGHMSEKARGKALEHEIYRFGAYYVLILSEPAGTFPTGESLVAILDTAKLDPVSWYLW